MCILRYANYTLIKIEVQIKLRKLVWYSNIKVIVILKLNKKVCIGKLLWGPDTMYSAKFVHNMGFIK